ncbi:MAG TPA: GMC family oxidoreductase N-terminal domain-containing protein [Solirubrobacterales bacterium]|nr:GMC family oxidoreductase N-terminal domain-containing protein [Solirubrobacterales bacterium]
MRGQSAERFVVFALRVLALTFAVVGILYVALPSPTLDVISDVGELLGNHTRAPHTQEYMWLALGFAYMVVITGICLIAQADVVRHRPLLLLLAAGKAASSLTSLAFFLVQDQVFAYLLGALVDGTLILVALWLWALVGRVDRPLAPGGRYRGGLGGAERRTLSAICAAMAPGVDGLPAAERDVDVSGPVAEFLRAAPPDFLMRLRLGLRAFEWMPFPHRFSRLDQAGRERFLRRLDDSRSPLRHDLLLMAKLFSTLGYVVTPAVQAKVGYELGCGLAEGGAPEPAGTLGDTEPRGEGEECDVVIVGSGAGGAVAAATLAEAGLDVLVLEAGGHHQRGTYPGDQLDAIKRLYRGGGLTVAAGRPPIVVPVAQAVGGTTVVNSGTCFRAPESVLDDWARRFGIGWARDLDGDFAEAEEMLRVTPLDPGRMGRNGRLALAGATALGARGGPISRNAGNCVQCSSCPFGCPLDAKRGMHVTYLPRAVAAGARVRAGVEARRVLVEDGRAVGVVCRLGADGTAAPFTVRARRAVVLAAGALGTPELLLRSGLGGGAVGRNLHVHPACWVGARHEEEVRGWEGVMQSYYVDEWESRGVLLEATFTPPAFGGAWLGGSGAEHQRAILDLGHVASIGVQLTDRSAGRVRLGPSGALRASYSLSRDDAARLTFGIARAAQVHFAAGATEVYPNLAGVKVLRPGDLASFEARAFKPSELRLEGFHPMGTARIAADPRQGACAPDGSLHGTADLYVADASLFPTALGVNPMMTIIAFARQVAREVAAASPARKDPRAQVPASR